MKLRALPPLIYLKECFLYERETGKLYWKYRPKAHFVNSAVAQMWNTRFAGREAFCTSSRGYRAGHLDNAYCAAHRVIWKLVTGDEPPDIIDHVDRNKANNRWSNLRAATAPENCVNLERPVPPSGFSGVHKHKNKGKWVAQAGGKGARYIGIFDSPEEASAARAKAMREIYGEFAE